MHNLFMLIIASFLKGVQTLFIQNKRLKGEIIHTSLKSRENHLILKTSVMAKQILNLPVIKKVVKKLSFFSNSNKNMSEFISLINEDHFIR